jgi:uncharacterized protein
MQSFIAIALFNGWGLGLWGQVGPAWQVALAFAIFFGVQVPLSLWWFRHHEQGPLEYLWRVFTYGGRPASKRTAAPLPPG